MRGAIRRFAGRLARGERGQSTAEYTLLISVIVVAVVAAGWAFYNPLDEGSKSFGNQFTTYYADSPLPH